MSPIRDGRSWPWISLLCFALAATGIPLAIAGVTRLVDAQPGENALKALRRIESELDALSRHRVDERSRRIAYLGDSTVYSFKPSSSLPHLLQAALQRPLEERMTLEVRSLAYPALGIIAHYLLADRIVEAKPDLIVWQTSFTHFSTRWRLHNLRSPFAGWVDARRLPELAAMPIESGGLTLDRLLLYQAVVSLRAVGLWGALAEEQSRVEKLRGHLEEWIARRTGVWPEKLFRRVGNWELHKRNVYKRDGRQRFTAEMERSRHRYLLAGLDSEDLVLQMLRRALARFRDAGIPVIVYLNPLNVDNMAAVGLPREGEIARGAQTIREAVESSGARFLDFHDVFPDAYFRDAAGHLVHEGEVDANIELIRKLAGPVMAELVRTTRP